MYDHLRRNSFEIGTKTSFLLETLPELRSGQVFENARYDPAGDVNAASRTVCECRVSGEPAEHGAKHIERCARCRAVFFQRSMGDLGCIAHWRIDPVECRDGTI